MKTERIIWGIVLLFIGGILLLQNFDQISFDWATIWRFWPVILILIGVNMLFSYSTNKAGSLVSILITIIVLSFIAYKGINTSGREGIPFFDEGDLFNKDTDKLKSTVFSEPFVKGTRLATLNIKGGATMFILKDSSSTLVTAQVKKTYGNYSLFKTSGDSTETVDFKMTGKSNWDMNKSKANQVVLALNTQPLWAINLETGAGKTEFDLTRFKISTLKLQGGVASFDIKMGDLNKYTVVTIESGISEINISVPESSGCTIKTDSGLSSSDFEGFNSTGKDSYQTSNFNTASSKIIINMKGGFSKFHVDRY
ncbi:hypothetical protein ADIARSV_1007 [Arcticibacter svalbardensis MN12-7]|uniref:LiaI-LiaF-like transmembrane region domain-containing protein n=1 Tax=Arcticibacter svalbardensis MN12-7 TaxID=1150600 RepID=R9H3F4_9SPHI|nr:DUF5668 domain-containing protein [Arcticibacter svalbardensis]EOR95694.1 hypothetical protein ADIARSV_1007 [Arcticibacter svalbardensis MN12-7]